VLLGVEGEHGIRVDERDVAPLEGGTRRLYRRGVLPAYRHPHGTHPPQVRAEKGAGQDGLKGEGPAGGTRRVGREVYEIRQRKIRGSTKALVCSQWIAHTRVCGWRSGLDSRRQIVRGRVQVQILILLAHGKLGDNYIMSGAVRHGLRWMHYVNKPAAQGCH